MAMAPTPIAVIGVGCRLPGNINNSEDLWSMVYEHRNGHGPVPPSRWNADAFHHPDPNAPESIIFKSGHFLRDDIAAFDARFFGITPGEAASMDPQQRLLLEVSCEAIESAGLTLNQLRGSATGVFMAQFCKDYATMMAKDLQQAHKLTLMGTGDALVANRISYHLDLRGPSMTLDTGCSGSMVAIHQACQSLRDGESKVAMAGGAQLIISPDQSVLMSGISMMNAQGKCFVFDEQASGYGRGEGAGVLILKRLDDALSSGDHVHAVIMASGINQDGKTNGIQLPKAEAQTALIRSVYRAAGLDPAETLYIEAHGTGTQAGDMAEVESLHDAFCAERRQNPLRVGSVKANIGHLEAASGVAAVIKAIMVLKKSWVPGNIRLNIPKPSLQLAQRPLVELPKEGRPLAPVEHRGPKYVSVNGFGYGGTNSHLILGTLEEITESNQNKAAGTKATVLPGDYLPKINNETGGQSSVHTNGVGASGLVGGERHPSRLQTIHKPIQNGPHLFLLSAASRVSFDQVTVGLQNYLSTRTETLALADLSQTLLTRRSIHAWRATCVAHNVTDLSEKLAHIVPTKATLGNPASITFVFTGQGAQWYAMGRELVSRAGIFHDSIVRSSELIRSWGAPWVLEEELLRDEQTTRLDESHISQPATTAIQIAMVDLLAGFGVRPQKVCGHSSGEIAAAYAAGCLSHEAALKASYFRGIFSAAAKQRNRTRGAMLAVGLGENEMRPLVKAMPGRIVLACVNSPFSTTVSGDQDTVDEIATSLNKRGVFNRKLKLDTAYHSHHMHAVAQDYLSSLVGLEHGDPHVGVDFYSSVTGTRKTTDFGAEYWTQNLISPVKFDSALRAAAGNTLGVVRNSGPNIFIEIGPHSALQGPIRQIMSSQTDTQPSYAYLSPLRRKENALHTCLEATGRLIELGYGLFMANLSSLSSQIKATAVLPDLPTYPWDHSTTYWHESRLSRDHRFRRFPYHDLIGVLDVLGGIHNPTWRHHLSLESMPWLRHHVVDNGILFPGSGYLCMAIEALGQLLKLRQEAGRVQRFRVRHATFFKPLVVPETGVNGKGGKVEVQITLAQESAMSSTTSPWEIFRISSYDSVKEEWTLHCSGLVSAEMYTSTQGLGPQVDGAQRLAETLKSIEKVSTHDIDVEQFYNDLASSGNAYGSTFRTLRSVRVAKEQGYGHVMIPDIAATMPANHLSPHLVHPATLDALHHLGPLLFAHSGGLFPVVFASVQEMTIYTNIKSSAGSELLVAGRVRGHKREAAGSFTVFQQTGDRLEPVITMVDSRLRSVGDSCLSKEENVFSRHRAYKMEWFPDIRFLDNGQLARYLETFDPLTDIDRKMALDELYYNNKAALVFIKRALRWMEENGEEPDRAAPHLSRLFEWMRGVSDTTNTHILADAFHLGEVAEDSSDELILAKSARMSSMGEGIARIGPQLHEILTGKDNGLHYLFSDDLAERIYQSTMNSVGESRIAEIVRLLSASNPNMKILEIGAGTGVTTSIALEALDLMDGPSFSQYEFTDVSTGFFEKAKIKFAKWASKIRFRSLDVSRDPGAQGFSLGDYDLVIAANVLHATPNLGTTMTHCRRLLKEGGHLLLVEITRPLLELGINFGVLPGWWASEDGRTGSPILPASGWDHLVQEHGFAPMCCTRRGSDLDWLSIMVTSAVTRSASKLFISESVCVVLGSADLPESQHAYAFAKNLISFLSQHLIKASATSLDKIEIREETTYIVIDCMDRPYLGNPSSTTFLATQKLFLQADRVLWVSVSSSDLAEATALKGIVTGLARVTRNENPYINLTTVDVRDVLSHENSREICDSILQIAIQNFWSGLAVPDGSLEREFAIEAGRVLIPRIRTDTHFSDWIHSSRRGANETRMVPLFSDSRYLKLDIETPGLLNTLRFIDDEHPRGTLADHEVDVHPFAWGINSTDVQVALGQQAADCSICGEFAGVVTAVGAGMTGQYQPGDRIAGISAEPFASHVRINGDLAAHIPDDLSFAEAAASVASFGTAWSCLVNIANLRKGETVLIQDGSGSVGQAAIQVAQYLGATIYTTVGTTAEREYIIERYGLTGSNILHSTSSLFPEAALDLTHGKGFNVVINSIQGDQLRLGIECTAAFGRVVSTGKTQVQSRDILDLAAFNRGISLTGFDIGFMGLHMPKRIREALRAIFGLVREKQLRSKVPIIEFPIGQIDSAFRSIATQRQRVGKVVVTGDRSSIVKASLPQPKPMELHADASYVVVGGLGDIGWRICLLLARFGAGTILTIGRSRISQERQVKCTEEIERLGSRLYIRQGDAVDKQSLVDIALWCQENTPAVRGVFHCGMVLRDRPLELMTCTEFTTALNPKVQGTLNLEEVFGKDDTLDNFVLMSSSAGIVSSSGQANYAAGCTFQDAFADAQNARGRRTRYVTIDLGAVAGTAAIRKVDGIMKDQKGFALMSLEEVDKLIEYALRPCSGGSQPSHCITGFDRRQLVEFKLEHMLKNPMFSFLPVDEEFAAAPDTGAAASAANHDGTQPNIKSPHPDIPRLLQAATTVAQAAAIILAAALDKFSAFLDREVPSDVPTSHLAIDSLVAIELKTWVARTFSAQVQASEVAGSMSLADLAGLLARRSNFVSEAVKKSG